MTKNDAVREDLQNIVDIINVCKFALNNTDIESQYAVARVLDSDVIPRLEILDENLSELSSDDCMSRCY